MAHRIVISEGIRWIDFESCCIGLHEWDLAPSSVAIPSLPRLSSIAPEAKVVKEDFRRHLTTTAA
jgi:hypothetical protein